MGTMTEAPTTIAAQLLRTLTPELLNGIYKLFFRWSDTHPLSDAKTIVSVVLGDSENIDDEFYQLAFPALLSLSSIGLEKVAKAPLSLLIPASPAQMAFPAQAMGLHLLLDQGPRLLNKGTNARWIIPFHLTDVAICEKLLLLRDESNPYKIEAWRGLSYERIVLRQIIMLTAQIHCERSAEQALGQRLVEAIRLETEKHYKIKDATRATDKDDNNNVTLFPDLIRAGPASHLKTSSEGIFHCLRVLRVHEPIIRVFGRYPHRNAQRWTQSTEAELEWLREIDNFGKVDCETEKLIREDTEAGRFSPLRKL